MMTLKISKYAYGKDYHEVIREKLNKYIENIKSEIGDFHGRGFVDSAPVLERTWAQRSGLGWVGKNGNLINKQMGSFFFIATLITDLDLEPDEPFAKDYCGTCTRCIDACPTDAILPGKIVDGSKCISYFTIELKEMLIPNEMKGKFETGCLVAISARMFVPGIVFQNQQMKLSLLLYPKSSICQPKNGK